MKFFIAFAALIALALAAPAPQNPQDVQVLRYDNDVRPDGYQFAFDTSDGTSRSEQGELRNAGTDHAAIAVRGSVSWVAADGQQYSLNYVADENGYQPEGAHLPKSVV